MYNIDNVDDGEPIAALRLVRTNFQFSRQGDWKLVQRPSGTSDWIEEPGFSPNPTNSPRFVSFFAFWSRDPPTTPIKSTRPAPPPPVPTNATYLFNLAADPEERIDLSSQRPDLVQAMVRLKRGLPASMIHCTLVQLNKLYVF